MSRVLEAILGSRSATYTLLFLQEHGEGHASLITRTSAVSPMGIQRQLKLLENNAVLNSRLVGRTRVFTFNDSHPSVRSLRAFLAAELERSGKGKGAGSRNGTGNGNGTGILP